MQVPLIQFVPFTVETSWRHKVVHNLAPTCPFLAVSISCNLFSGYLNRLFNDHATLLQAIVVLHGLRQDCVCVDKITIDRMEVWGSILEPKAKWLPCQVLSDTSRTEWSLSSTMSYAFSEYIFSSTSTPNYLRFTIMALSWTVGFL